MKFSLLNEIAVGDVLTEEHIREVDDLLDRLFLLEEVERDAHALLDTVMRNLAPADTVAPPPLMTVDEAG